MRAKLNLRASRVAKIAVGALLVAVPSAVAGETVGKPAIVTTSEATAPADHAPDYRIRVHVKVDHHRANTVAGRTITIRGRASEAATESTIADAADAAAIRHATSDARVKLQVRKQGHWRLAQHIRTGSHGKFAFHFRVTRAGVTRLRVLFVGNSLAHRTTHLAGQVTGLTPVVASWYYDQGDTACGFHATYGVANKTLPCGTHVTISYGGRTLVATVDDRGPYVAGRDFDLDQTTAERLGFDGVGTVYVSRR